MPCFKPIVMVKCGKTKNGKDNLKIVKDFSFNYEDYQDDKHVLVPCGCCLGCRLDYANIWAERCSLEASMHKENMFLTLTYDDRNCPLKLSKKDFQLFIKRLRNFFNDEKIRYFGCGERGSLSGRPHMHIIIFGAKFDDLKFYKKSGDYFLYTSDKLAELWPYGFSTIGEAEYNTMAYTARYVLKKLKGNKCSDEFVLMSRKPGIGASYYEIHKDKIKKDKLIYHSFNENKKSTYLNRYFKKLIAKDDEDFVNNFNKDAISKVIQKVVSDKHVYGLKSQWDLNKHKEIIKEEKIKALKRGL